MHKPAFAVWITGLPASGKSTVTQSLREQLQARNLDVAVLESDVLRPIFTPGAAYRPEDRDHFYRQLAFVGALPVRHGVPVIFDATANLRRYRDAARGQIPHFLEIFLDCPLELCIARDPKGIYQRAGEGQGAVPGLDAAYEPPLHPDLTIVAGCETPAQSAARIVAALQAKGFLAVSTHD